MAKGGGATAGAIIASVLISFVLTGVGAYFLLPLAFPNMKEGVTPAFKYEEFDSSAQILDTALTYTMVPDTFFNITIQEGSQLKCTFSGSVLLGLWYLLGTEEVSYLLALGVEDAATYITEYWKFVNIQYYDADGVSGGRELSFTCTIELVSAPLEAGTYRVSLWWRSEQTATGNNYLLFNTPSFDYNRSLSALEILA